MRLKLLAFALLAVILSSCSTIKHTSAVAPVEAKVLSFTVADMQVKPVKMTKTISWSYNPFRSVSIETIKTNATAMLLLEADADVLLEPEYIIEKRGWLRGGSVTVIGFPAKFTDFHKMTPEEAELFKATLPCRKSPDEKEHNSDPHRSGIGKYFFGMGGLFF